MTSTAPKNHKTSAAEFMQRLRRDHAGLSRMLRAIDTLVDRLATEPETVQPILVEAFGYLLDYQHGYHHPREDRLFEKIQAKRPSLADTLEKLSGEHDIGEHEAAELVEDLAAATPDRLRGKQDDRLAVRIHDYIRHARAHMRDEEAVFYARAEQVLNKSDWTAITENGVDKDGLQDPLADMETLAADYPLLAAHFDLPTRDLEVSEAIDSPSSAMHNRALALTDLCGGLMHEGLNLTRRNANRVLAVRGPIGLARAVTAITSDNLRFAGECVARPSRWALNTGTDFLVESLSPNGKDQRSSD